MNFYYLKTLLAGLLINLFSWTVYAEVLIQDEANKQKSFQTICVDSWMKRVSDVKDQVGYKIFGEKYCNCAQTQPLDNDAAVNQAIQVCISRTLLHETMNSLKNNVDLNKVTENDIEQHCQDKWNLIYPQTLYKEKQNTLVYCECSKSRLFKLLEQTGNRTEKEYEDQIDAIAAACSATIVSTEKTQAKVE
ncbi:hypothetical protein [Legionella fairfieldensis]|uniref:hypothetical protein n=1 Tax=Legionella fairfieldensis TaxID=45064 RepID=UPI000490432D|nr:hypothetical protein [Legionella fairfieldensis]